MPLSPQAFSAPSKQMHGSNPKGDLNSIASISTSSTISIPSSEPSASKPRDSKLKREQNPRYRRHNGLTTGRSPDDKGCLMTTDDFRHMALSLPGAEELNGLGYPNFRAGRKSFA